MKFNLDNKTECEEAFEYLTELVGKHAIAEVIKVSPKRTLSQNSYLHLIIAAFGNHFGYTAEEAKMVYKYLNAEVYRYKHKNLTFWRSSADLSKDEMTGTIDKFRQASANQGYDLPLALDQEWLMRLGNEVERANYYLENKHGTE
jgi:hypothetical protein